MRRPANKYSIKKVLRSHQQPKPRRIQVQNNNDYAKVWNHQLNEWISKNPYSIKGTLLNEAVTIGWQSLIDAEQHALSMDVGESKVLETDPSGDTNPEHIKIAKDLSTACVADETSRTGGFGETAILTLLRNALAFGEELQIADAPGVRGVFHDVMGGHRNPKCYGDVNEVERSYPPPLMCSVKTTMSVGYDQDGTWTNNLGPSATVKIQKTGWMPAFSQHFMIADDMETNKGTLETNQNQKLNLIIQKISEKKIVDIGPKPEGKANGPMVIKANPPFYLGTGADSDEHKGFCETIFQAMLEVQRAALTNPSLASKPFLVRDGDCQCKHVQLNKGNTGPRVLGAKGKQSGTQTLQDQLIKQIRNKAGQYKLEDYAISAAVAPLKRGTVPHPDGDTDSKGNVLQVPAQSKPQGGNASEGNSNHIGILGICLAGGQWKNAANAQKARDYKRADGNLKTFAENRGLSDVASIPPDDLKVTYQFMISEVHLVSNVAMEEQWKHIGDKDGKNRSGQTAQKITKLSYTQEKNAAGDRTGRSIVNTDKAPVPQGKKAPDTVTSYSGFDSYLKEAFGQPPAIAQKAGEMAGPYGPMVNGEKKRYKFPKYFTQDLGEAENGGYVLGEITFHLQDLGQGFANTRAIARERDWKACYADCLAKSNVAADDSNVTKWNNFWNGFPPTEENLIAISEEMNGIDPAKFPTVYDADAIRDIRSLAELDVYDGMYQLFQQYKEMIGEKIRSQPNSPEYKALLRRGECAWQAFQYKFVQVCNKLTEDSDGTLTKVGELLNDLAKFDRSGAKPSDREGAKSDEVITQMLALSQKLRSFGATMQNLLLIDSAQPDSLNQWVRESEIASRFEDKLPEDSDPLSGADLQLWWRDKISADQEKLEFWNKFVAQVQSAVGAFAAIGELQGTSEEQRQAAIRNQNNDAKSLSAGKGLIDMLALWSGQDMLENILAGGAGKKGDYALFSPSRNELLPDDATEQQQSEYEALQTIAEESNLFRPLSDAARQGWSRWANAKKANADLGFSTWLGDLMFGGANLVEEEDTTQVGWGDTDAESLTKALYLVAKGADGSAQYHRVLEKIGLPEAYWDESSTKMKAVRSAQTEEQIDDAISNSLTKPHLMAIINKMGNEADLGVPSGLDVPTSSTAKPALWTYVKGMTFKATLLQPTDKNLEKQRAIQQGLSRTDRRNAAAKTASEEARDTQTKAIKGTFGESRKRSLFEWAKEAGLID